MPDTCTTYFLNKCVVFFVDQECLLFISITEAKKKCMRYKRRSDKEEMAECVSWVHRGPSE